MLTQLFPTMLRTLAPFIFSVPFLASLALAAAASDRVTFARHPDRIRIEIGGKHFSDYIHAGWPKPSLYPILDADGTSYTRDFPFKKNPAEVPDHDWHRGVWFAHGVGHAVWDGDGGLSWTLDLADPTMCRCESGAGQPATCTWWEDGSRTPSTEITCE